jgi:hypothetical protein
MKTYSDSLSEIIANRKKAPQGTRWFHKKSGDTYVVVNHGLREETLEPSVLYSNGGVLWDRLAEEFFDGRFEMIEDPIRTSHNTETTDAEYLPHWAERRADGWEVKASLPTRDGRRTGNGVITAFESKTYHVATPQQVTVELAVVVTDAGHIIRCTEAELEELFYTPMWIMKDLLPAHSNALIEELDQQSDTSSISAGFA